MDGLLFLLDQAGRTIAASYTQAQEENRALREQIEALSAQIAGRDGPPDLPPSPSSP